MGWLFSAYAVVWIVFFVYLLGLDRKQREVAHELAKLKEKLGDR